MGQGSPLAPGAVQVQNGIDHFTHLGSSGVSSWLGGRESLYILHAGKLSVTVVLIGWPVSTDQADREAGANPAQSRYCNW